MAKEPDYSRLRLFAGSTVASTAERLVVLRDDALYELRRDQGSAMWRMGKLVGLSDLKLSCSVSGPLLSHSGEVFICDACPYTESPLLQPPVHITLYSWHERERSFRRFASFDTPAQVGDVALYQWVEATRTALFAQGACDGVVVWTTTKLSPTHQATLHRTGAGEIAAAFTGLPLSRWRDADTVIFSRDGPSLVVGGLDWLAICDGQSGRVRKIPMNVDFFGPMAVSNDKQTLAWIGDTTGRRRTWDPDVDYGPTLSTIGVTSLRTGRSSAWQMKELSSLPLYVTDWDHIAVSPDGAVIYFECGQVLGKPDVHGATGEGYIARLEVATGKLELIGAALGAFTVLDR